MYHRDKLSVSEIARRTSISRNTIKKWLHAPGAAEPKYIRQSTGKIVTAYEAKLRKALETDSHRPKHERRTARKLWQEIRDTGFGGSYSRVTEFVRRWRIEAGQPGSIRAFVPLHFALGEAFQFDWSEEGLVVGGIYAPSEIDVALPCRLYIIRQSFDPVGTTTKYRPRPSPTLYRTDWGCNSSIRLFVKGVASFGILRFLPIQEELRFYETRFDVNPIFMGLTPN